MSDETFLKCPCQKCGERIEFPNNGVGQIIRCPHCGTKTTLFFAADICDPIPAATSGRKSWPMVVGTLLVVGLIAAVWLWQKMSVPKEIRQNDVASNSLPAISLQKTNAEPPPDWHGLKSSEVTLEKSAGSRLIYAVGIIRNESDHERFGVRVELDLFDARGEKAGSAKDYVASLQPGKSWKFKAMVTETKAVRAVIMAVKEDN